MPCCHDLARSPCTFCQCATLRKNGLNKQSSKTTNESKFSDPEVHPPIQKFCSPDSISGLIQSLKDNPKNLEAVLKFVQNNNGKKMVWENSKDCLGLCDLSGTIYMGQRFMQEAWEQLYLPKETRMQVLGTLHIMRDCEEWIILVGEDGCVYAYEEEELQLIARSLSEFVENGKRNAYSTYFYPESSSEDEYMQEDEEILKIRQRTRDFVNRSANKFDDFLNFISS